MQESEILNMMKNMKPNRYGVTVTLGKNPGNEVIGSIETDDRDFAITHLQHAVVGDVGTDQEQYSIEFSLGNDEYFHKGPIPPMAKFYGSTHTNIWDEFIPAIQVTAKTTIYVKLVNRYAAVQANDLDIQIWFKGDELRKQR
jgi:hypothetical protein